MDAWKLGKPSVLEPSAPWQLQRACNVRTLARVRVPARFCVAEKGAPPEPRGSAQTLAPPPPWCRPRTGPSAAARSRRTTPCRTPSAETRLRSTPTARETPPRRQNCGRGHGRRASAQSGNASASRGRRTCGARARLPGAALSRVAVRRRNLLPPVVTSESFVMGLLSGSAAAPNVQATSTPPRKAAPAPRRRRADAMGAPPRRPRRCLPTLEAHTPQTRNEAGGALAAEAAVFWCFVPITAHDCHVPALKRRRRRAWRA